MHVAKTLGKSSFSQMPVATLNFIIEMAERGPNFRRALQCQNADRRLVIKEATIAILIDMPSIVPFTGKLGKVSQLSTFLL